MHRNTSDYDAFAPNLLGFSKARTDIPVSSACILLKIIILFNKKILDMWAVESVSGGIIFAMLHIKIMQTLTLLLLVSLALLGPYSRLR